MDSGFLGIAAFGFWMFIAAATVGGIWDGIRKREAEHETLRRIIESGKQPDQQLMDKLLGHNKAPERDLKVAGLIVIFVAPGLAVMGWLIDDDAFMPLLGVAMLVAFVGLGLLTAAQFMKKAREADSSNNPPTIR
ncbi:MAG: DUF6249 domain-containing protein [Woeseiaceae bacterium]